MNATRGARAAPGRHTFQIFGTTAVLLVTDPDAGAPARAIADAELAAIDRAGSRFRQDSELCRLNAAAAGGRPHPVSGLFAELIEVALRAARLTAGDVDPTCGHALAVLGYDRDFAEVRAAQRGPALVSGPVPGWRRVHLDRAALTVRLEPGVCLDLGATAKAWAADRCAALIAATLGCGALMSLGGDLAVAGPAPGDGWQIRVTDDHADRDGAPGQTITITSGGLATSSTTVRSWHADGRLQHHIIDPATGEPARTCWRTASVAAGTCTDANTASTAAIIRGDAAAAWLDSAGLPARLVRHDGTVLTTAGWPAPDGGPAQDDGQALAPRRQGTRPDGNYDRS